MADDQRDSLAPSEKRGGTTPGETEAREKGAWAATASEGIVPGELGGSDAPEEMLGADPELGSASLGGTARTQEPATQAGIDRSAGDGADATSLTGAAPQPGEAEPDLRDAARGPRQTDVRSAE